MVFSGCAFEYLQVIRAYLVPKPAGTAVDHAADLPECKAKRFCRTRVKNFTHNLDFEEMIA
jgi:hypothetical protein